MAKLTQVHLHGKSYQMPANFRVLSIINDEVCDPLKVMAALGVRDGKNKSPEFPLSQRQCVTLLRIGVQAAGCIDSADDIDESVFQLGPEKYVPLSMAYLASFCAGEERADRAPKAALAKPPVRR